MGTPTERSQATIPIEKEIDSFSTQQKHIRSLINSIAGNSNRKKDKFINYFFLSAITALFAIEIATDLLPPLLSLEIGILLVSVKIVWMIHMQSRFQHFTFWVLNAIEQKLNLIDERVRKENVQSKEGSNIPPPETRHKKNQDGKNL